MKSKEHSRHVIDKVVEKFKAGLGFKSVSQALNIKQSAVQAIIIKFNKNSTTPKPTKTSTLLLAV